MVGQTQLLSSGPPAWGRQKGVTPICSDLRSLCSAGIPRFAPISSDVFLEQVRTNQGKPFSADPSCNTIGLITCHKNLNISGALPNLVGSSIWSQRFTYRVVREGVIAEKCPQMSANFPQNFRKPSAKKPFANDPLSELLKKRAQNRK